MSAKDGRLLTPIRTKTIYQARTLRYMAYVEHALVLIDPTSVFTNVPVIYTEQAKGDRTSFTIMYLWLLSSIEKSFFVCYVPDVSF